MSNQLSSYNFPDAYSTVVSAFTGTVKYIATTGSNSNNGDSISTPYLTIAYAISQTTATTEVMYVILEGTYSETATVVQTDSSAVILDGGKKRVFVGCPGRTIVQWTASASPRDCQMVDFSNTGSAAYGLIFKRNNGGRTTNYSVAFFRSYAGATKGNFYNCVFQETNANNAWSFQYDNYGGANFALRNCTFYNGAAAAGNYSGGTGCSTIDSVFNTTCTTAATETNVLKSQTVNSSTYVTTGVTTAGVYSGTYAWNGTTTYTYATVSSTTGSPTINTNVIYNGNSYTTYTFTSSGSITIGTAGVVDYLVVAGGGGGGFDVGGGGGAGGLLYGTTSVLATTLTVTVGAGGLYAGTNAVASNGSNSVFGALTAIGGGGGGSWSGISAASGGSGGGGTSNTTSVAAATTGQGYAGGAGSGNTGSTNDYSGAAGGGGSDQAGGNGTTSGWSAASTTYGYGGRGKSDSQLGGILTTGVAGQVVSGVRYIAGGGGASSDVGTYYGVGGAGGGGQGGNSPGTGVVNTGSGGGGGGLPNPGASGGSGIVIVRIKNANLPPGLYFAANSVASGSSIVLAASSSNVSTGNLPYTITGVTSSQISTALTGNISMTSGSGNLTIVTLPYLGATYTITVAADGFSSNVSLIPNISISTAIIEVPGSNVSAYLENPVAGQMEIPKSVTTELNYSVSSTPLVSTANRVNPVSLSYTTMTNSIAGPIEAGVIKVFGDIPQREYWM